MVRVCGGRLEGRRSLGLRRRDAQRRRVLGERELADRRVGAERLGGRLDEQVEDHLRAHGAIVFPADHRAPVDPYRARLYTPQELYAGLAEDGYDATVDARAYRWFEDATVRHDAYVTALRAIHDDAMSDALTALVQGRRVVGVMGGHALRRGTDEFAAAGADLIIVHQESVIHLDRSIQHIKHLGKKAGVALCPATSVQALELILEQLDLVLIMTVNPGFGGQEFIGYTLEKIRRVREMLDARNLNCDIEVDGGIELHTIRHAYEAGANVFVAGTAVFGYKDGPEAGVQSLIKAA